MASSFHQAKFLYGPLDTHEPSFRLLNVLPFSTENPVQCTIRHARLPTIASPEPHYNALSYAWGEQSPSTQQLIAINGKSFKVGYRLYRFLLFASKNLPELRSSLWIDAMCINQTDTAERNHQVQQMGDIYRKAQTVFVWLGLEDETQLDERRVRNFFRYQLERLRLRDRGKIGDQIQTIAECPYWTRMWIVQELALAQNIRIIYESRCLRWKTVEDHLSRAHYSAKDGDDINYKQNAAAKLVVRFETLTIEAKHEDKTATTYAGSHSLSALMLEFGGNQCSEPRDKVFALLGLASNGAGFRVDYDLSICEIFFKVLQHDEELNLPYIMFLRRTLGIDLTQLRVQLHNDLSSEKEYTSGFTRLPMDIVEVLGVGEDDVSWQPSPVAESSAPIKSNDENGTLMSGDLICCLIFDPFSRARGKDSKAQTHPSKFAVVLREDSTGIYKHFAMTEVVKHPNSHSWLSYSKKFDTFYRLFHAKSFGSTRHELYRHEDSDEPLGLLLQPLALLTLLEIAEIRGSDSMTLNDYGEPGQGRGSSFK